MAGLYQRELVKSSLPRRICKPHIRRLTTSSETVLDGNDSKDYFSFSRGRFLRDEAQELSKRYVKFNVEELARTISRTTNSNHCVDMHKFADGMHNKAFLLTTDNGAQAVGKIPNLVAGLPHFTTASEVATMDFMRDTLGIPVPNVLSWSSKRDNPIGTEYIIMEKVIRKLAKYQTDWTATCFSQFGSLYYKRDLSPTSSLEYTDKDGNQITNDRFAIGPSTSRQNIDDGRHHIEFDRGPWNTAEEYEKATGMREIACIEQFSQLLRSPIALYGPGTYRPSKEKKLEAALGYLKLVKYLLPDDPSIPTSHIWHDDLHTENIFVNPDDPSDILAIIDWQSTELAPLYDHTIVPYVLDYDGPPVEGLEERPDLAEIRKQFESDPVSQEKAESLYVKMSLVALYRRLIQLTNPQLFRVLKFHQTTQYRLLLFARNLLVDGEATYLALLAEFRKEWPDLPRVRSEGNTEFPLQFTEEKLAAITADSEGATHGINLIHDLKDRVGGQFFWAQGLVDHAQFDKAKEELRRVKADLIREYSSNEDEEKEWDDAWPFDD